MGTERIKTFFFQMAWAIGKHILQPFSFFTQTMNCYVHENYHHHFPFKTIFMVNTLTVKWKNRKEIGMLARSNTQPFGFFPLSESDSRRGIQTGLSLSHSFAIVVMYG